jgi:hypothetical protein
MRRMPVAAVPALALFLLPVTAFAEGEESAALSPGSNVQATDPLVEALTGLAGAALGVEGQPPVTPPSGNSGTAGTAAPAGASSTIVVKVAPAGGEAHPPETSQAAAKPAEDTGEDGEAEPAASQPAIVVQVTPKGEGEVPQTAAKEGEETDPAPKAVDPPAIVVQVTPGNGQAAAEHVVQIESSAQGQALPANAPAVEQTSSHLAVKLVVAAINVAVLLLAALLV